LKIAHLISALNTVAYGKVEICHRIQCTTSKKDRLATLSSYQPFKCSVRFVPFPSSLLSRCCDFLCTQRYIVYSDIIDQARPESSEFHTFAGADVQAVTDSEETGGLNKVLAIEADKHIMSYS